MHLSSDVQLVIFRGGFTARLDVVLRLLSIEARGGRFIAVAGGAFKVDPSDVLTPEDRAFVWQYRDECRRVLAYQADDSHLFSDATKAQPSRLPLQERAS